MRHLPRVRVTHLALVVMACVISALGATVLAQSQEPRAPVSNAFTFQGRAEVDGVPVDGDCDLRFRLFNAAVTGTQTGPTVDRLAVPVAGGLFSVPLDFGAGVFTGEARFLAIELRCPAGTGSYVALPGRQELTATPYALYAQQVPYTGIIGGPPGFGEGWENVIVVAKSGGQFTSIQAALDSISGASETNRFLVWVAPGIYEERITIPSYVTVRGADRDLVTIEVVGGGSLANSTAVTMSDHSTLESIRVEITGTAVETRAIQAQGSSAASSEIKISDVSAWCGATGDCSGLYVANTTLGSEGLEIEVFVSSPAVSTGDAFGIRATAAILHVSDYSIDASRSGNASSLETYGVYVLNATSYELERGFISVSSDYGAYGIIHLPGGEGVVSGTTIVGQSSGSATGVYAGGTTDYLVSNSNITIRGQGSATGLAFTGTKFELTDVEILREHTGLGEGTGVFVTASPESPSASRLTRVTISQPDGGFEGWHRGIYSNSQTVEGAIFVRNSMIYTGNSVVSVQDEPDIIIHNSLIHRTEGPGNTIICVESYGPFFPLQADCTTN